MTTRAAGETTGDQQHDAHGQDNPAPEREMSRDVFNIPQNVILNGIKDYPEDVQLDLIWLSGYIREVLRCSRGSICERLRCDYTTVYRVFTGSYRAKVDKFMASVRRLKEKASQPGGEFVETIVTRKVFQTLDLSRDHHSMVLIAGAPRRSKTVAVQEWQRRNNHGRAVYIDAPAVGGSRNLLFALAKKQNINVSRNALELAIRLDNSFDERNVILLDEVRRLLPQGRSFDVTALEFVRRLHDVTGCGVAFIGTDVFMHEIEHGRLSRYLEQIVGRIEETLYIPDKVSYSEAGDICRGFNPNAEVDLIRLAMEIANTRGRNGILFMLLRDAARIAQKKKEPLSASHLAAARAYRENMHRWPDEE